MKSVEEFMLWKDARNKFAKSIEKTYEKETDSLGWLYSDVLYSFLGIYTLGIYVYYPHEFQRNGTLLTFINEELGKPSYLKLKDRYKNYKALNELEELNSFLAVYESIGNLIPMWPGGNVHKGKDCNYYDLTEIYFNNFKDWRDYLVLEYPNACLEEIVDRSETYNMKEFIDNLDKEFYKKYLNEITQVIKNREVELKKQLHI